MANEKISEMAAATTPLTGVELATLVQGGANVQAPVSAIWTQQYAQFQYQEASGVAAATTPALPATVLIPLNTVVSNNITGASMTTSVITLSAGTYYASSETQGAYTTRRRLRLRDTTNGVTLVSGVNSTVATPARISWPAPLSGRFTLSGVTDMELQVFASGGDATVRELGIPAGSGENEIYASLEIWRLA